MGDTSQANNTTTLSSRHQHHYLSIFFAHGGVGEQLLSTHILSYLNSTELCTVSSVSKLFRSCSQVSQLWVSLLREDFSLPFSSPSLSSEFNVLLLRDATSDALSAKENYAKRLKERSWRYTQAKQAAIQAKDERKRFFRIRRIQSFLDITQFKILIPLPILALFLSIILTCLYIDGLNVNVWVCAAPLLFYFVYLFLSMAVACCAYQQQSNAASILGGLWQDMRGPIKAVYMETLRESPRLAAYAVLILVLCTLQVILVALKLYTQQQSSAGDGSFYLAWAIVFVPLWVLFILFCMAPLLGCFGDTPSFLFMGIFLWVPFVILFVCLTIKLTAEEDHTGGTPIRLAFILIPFWIIEGFAMMSSLGYMLLGFHYWRRGFLDNFCEYVGVFISTWLLIAPFVIFQALLCARDDGQAATVSASGALTPMLILLGWFLISSVAFAITFRTPFQGMREQNRREVDAGQTILFEV